MTRNTAKGSRRIRPYRSPLREDHTERTRERILEAALAEMEHAGPEGFSVPQVAERSGVALRTIYRHFATRDALVDAMWERGYGRVDFVDSRMPAKALPDAIAAAGARYEESLPLIRAALRCPRQAEIRRRTRPQRMKAVAAVLGPELEGLSPAARRRAMGIIHCLTVPGFWHMLRESWFADGTEAARAIAWVVRTLLKEIRRNPASLEE